MAYEILKTNMRLSNWNITLWDYLIIHVTIVNPRIKKIGSLQYNTKHRSLTQTNLGLEVVLLILPIYYKLGGGLLFIT